MTGESEWLIPWRQRGRSGPLSDNLLWRAGRLFVMDNHRLATWCWSQHIESAPRWGFVHIDRHWDAMWRSLDLWAGADVPARWPSLEAFRTATAIVDGEPMAIHRWDTIVSELLWVNRHRVSDLAFATNDEGDPPGLDAARNPPALTEVLGPDIRVEQWRPWEVRGGLLNRAEAPADDRFYPHSFIVDLDLDYFTWQSSDGSHGPLIADGYVRAIGQVLARGIATGKFGVVTIALSPETTGTWSLAEHYLRLVLEEFSLDTEFFAGAPPEAAFSPPRGGSR